LHFVAFSAVWKNDVIGEKFALAPQFVLAALIAILVTF
jgi:hypothetical protein